MERLEQEEVSVPVVVEFDDVDSFRLAHHARLVSYLERGRLRLLASLGMNLDGDGIAPVMYELNLRFRKPARLLEELKVTVFVREFDDYRLALGYRIHRDGETLVRARSVIAFADLSSGSLTTMPSEMTRTLRDLSGGQAARDQEG